MAVGISKPLDIGGHFIELTHEWHYAPVVAITSENEPDSVTMINKNEQKKCHTRDKYTLELSNRGSKHWFKHNKPSWKMKIAQDNDYIFAIYEDSNVNTANGLNSYKYNFNNQAYSFRYAEFNKQTVQTTPDGVIKHLKRSISISDTLISQYLNSSTEREPTSSMLNIFPYLVSSSLNIPNSTTNQLTSNSYHTDKYETAKKGLDVDVHVYLNQVTEATQSSNVNTTQTSAVVPNTMDNSLNITPKTKDIINTQTSYFHSYTNDKSLNLFNIIQETENAFPFRKKPFICMKKKCERLNTCLHANGCDKKCKPIRPLQPPVDSLNKHMNEFETSTTNLIANCCHKKYTPIKIKPLQPIDLQHKQTPSLCTIITKCVGHRKTQPNIKLHDAVILKKLTFPHLKKHSQVKSSQPPRENSENIFIEKEVAYNEEVTVKIDVPKEIKNHLQHIETLPVEVIRDAKAEYSVDEEILDIFPSELVIHTKCLVSSPSVATESSFASKTEQLGSKNANGTHSIGFFLKSNTQTKERCDNTFLTNSMLSLIQPKNAIKYTSNSINALETRTKSKSMGNSFLEPVPQYTKSVTCTQTSSAVKSLMERSRSVPVPTDEYRKQFNVNADCYKDVISHFLGITPPLVAGDNYIGTKKRIETENKKDMFTLEEQGHNNVLSSRTSAARTFLTKPMFTKLNSESSNNVTSNGIQILGSSSFTVFPITKALQSPNVLSNSSHNVSIKNETVELVHCVVEKSTISLPLVVATTQVAVENTSFPNQSEKHDNKYQRKKFNTPYKLTGIFNEIKTPLYEGLPGLTGIKHEVEEEINTKIEYATNQEHITSDKSPLATDSVLIPTNQIGSIADLLLSTKDKNTIPRSQELNKTTSTYTNIFLVPTTRILVNKSTVPTTGEEIEPSSYNTQGLTFINRSEGDVLYSYGVILGNKSTVPTTGEEIEPSSYSTQGLTFINRSEGDVLYSYGVILGNKSTVPTTEEEIDPASLNSQLMLIINSTEGNAPYSQGVILGNKSTVPTTEEEIEPASLNTQGMTITNSTESNVTHSQEKMLGNKSTANTGSKYFKNNVPEITIIKMTDEYHIGALPYSTLFITENTIFKINKSETMYISNTEITFNGLSSVPIINKNISTDVIDEKYIDYVSNLGGSNIQFSYHGKWYITNQKTFWSYDSNTNKLMNETFINMARDTSLSILKEYKPKIVSVLQLIKTNLSSDIMPFELFAHTFLMSSKYNNRFNDTLQWYGLNVTFNDMTAMLRLSSFENQHSVQQNNYTVNWVNLYNTVKQSEKTTNHDYSQYKIINDLGSYDVLTVYSNGTSLYKDNTLSVSENLLQIQNYNSRSEFSTRVINSTYINSQVTFTQFLYNIINTRINSNVIYTNYKWGENIYNFEEILATLRMTNITMDNFQGPLNEQNWETLITQIRSFEKQYFSDRTVFNVKFGSKIKPLATFTNGSTMFNNVIVTINDMSNSLKNALTNITSLSTDVYLEYTSNTFTETTQSTNVNHTKDIIKLGANTFLFYKDNKWFVTNNIRTWSFDSTTSFKMNQTFNNIANETTIDDIREYTHKIENILKTNETNLSSDIMPFELFAHTFLMSSKYNNRFNDTLQWYGLNVTFNDMTAMLRLSSFENQHSTVQQNNYTVNWVNLYNTVKQSEMTTTHDYSQYKIINDLESYDVLTVYSNGTSVYKDNTLSVSENLVKVQNYNSRSEFSLRFVNSTYSSNHLQYLSFFKSIIDARMYSNIIYSSYRWDNNSFNLDEILALLRMTNLTIKDAHGLLKTITETNWEELFKQLKTSKVLYFHDKTVFNFKFSNKTRELIVFSNGSTLFNQEIVTLYDISSSLSKTVTFGTETIKVSPLTEATKLLFNTFVSQILSKSYEEHIIILRGAIFQFYYNNEWVITNTSFMWTFDPATESIMNETFFKMTVAPTERHYLAYKNLIAKLKIKYKDRKSANMPFELFALSLLDSDKFNDRYNDTVEWSGLEITSSDVIGMARLTNLKHTTKPNPLRGVEVDWKPLYEKLKQADKTTTSDYILYKLNNDNGSHDELIVFFGNGDSTYRGKEENISEVMWIIESLAHNFYDITGKT